MTAKTTDRPLAPVLLFAATAGLLSVFAPAHADSVAATDAFRQQAAAHYGTILARLANQQKIDDDHAALTRVRRVAATLIHAAQEVRADSANWSWEIHVTSDRSIGAFCMAGGKILISTAVIDGLGLDDGELAALLGHEIAHALADHRRLKARADVDADGVYYAKESGIALSQEDEADSLGIRLAYRGGWPLASIVGLFEKLAAGEAPGTFNASHPPAASRLVAARELAATLQANKKNTLE